jgi:colicin import membrane protein
MTTEIAEYSKTEAALADLEQKYKGVVFDVTTAEGMQTARKGRAEIRKYRTSLEDLRKAIKAPALRRCQVIDEEARRITGALLLLETPIDEQIKKEEERKEFERNAAVRAEEERLAAEERARKEAEERRLAEERAAIERERAKLEQEKREREEAERAARLKLEADERAARERIEAADRQARLEREEADRAARQARQAEEDRLRAEREAVEKARREQEERERAEREAKEATERAARLAEEEKQREIQRKKHELLDAREMLSTFKSKFGHIEEFAPVVKAIDAYNRNRAGKPAKEAA